MHLLSLGFSKTKVGETRKKMFCPLPFYKSETKTQHEVKLKLFIEDSVAIKALNGMLIDETFIETIPTNVASGAIDDTVDLSAIKKIFYRRWMGQCAAGSMNEELSKCLALQRMQERLQRCDVQKC